MFQYILYHFRYDILIKRVIRACHGHLTHFLRLDYTTKSKKKSVRHCHKLWNNSFDSSVRTLTSKEMRNVISWIVKSLDTDFSTALQCHLVRINTICFIFIILYEFRVALKSALGWILDIYCLTYHFDFQSISYKIQFLITFCIRETPKRVFLQTVKIKMKCSIMLHFIRIYTICKG